MRSHQGGPGVVPSWSASREPGGPGGRPASGTVRRSGGELGGARHRVVVDRPQVNGAKLLLVPELVERQPGDRGDGEPDGGAEAEPGRRALAEHATGDDGPRSDRRGGGAEQALPLR